MADRQVGLRGYNKQNSGATLARGYNKWVTVMVKKVKLRAIGNSTGVVLPREVLEKLRVERGDELMVLETPEGIMLTSYDPEFARQMDVAEQVMRKRRNLLRKLAE